MNGWVGIQGLYAEGDTLEEFIKNAYAVKVDQDGGDVGFVEIDELPEEAINMLEEAYEKGN